MNLMDYLYCFPAGLGHSLFIAVFQKSETDSRRTAGIGIHEHQLGSLHRGKKRNFLAGLARLFGALKPRVDVNILHHHGTGLRMDLNYFTGLALILAGEDLHRIACFNLEFVHKISLSAHQLISLSANQIILIC